MLAKSLSALALVAFAAQTSASELLPYKPERVVKMSVRELFGVERRQTSPSDGYQPGTAVCNGTADATTCAAACGAGFEECAATASADTHCYNPTVGQTCCPDGSGNSCDEGFYCTADASNDVFCCPNDLSLTACAQRYATAVQGALTSEAPKPTSTSMTRFSSTSVAPTRITNVANSTRVSGVPSASTSCAQTVPKPVPSVGANTTAATSSNNPIIRPTSVPAAANTVAGPATALVLVAAAFVALL